jgi:hypothetical protein
MTRSRSTAPTWTQARRRTLATIAGAGVLALLVAGCSGGSDTADSADPGAAPPVSEGYTAPDAPVREAAAGEVAAQDTAASAAAVDRSVIRTATVTLESDDVRATADRARALAVAEGGAVTSEQTALDPYDADRSLATLVLRVPVDRLDRVLAALADVGELRDQAQSAVDVTGEVVDLEARIATQRASIDRVRVLLARAETIGDVVAVEAELTRREADLEALLARQAALADQAAQATVTLTVSGPGAAPPEEETGFLPGLHAGWDAFVAASTALLTGLGAVLPFAALALVVALPLATWRRRRRTRPAPTPAEDVLDPVG